MEGYVLATPRGRLKAKLLVFSSKVAMRRTWRAVSGSDLGPGAEGFVNSLQATSEKYENGVVVASYLDLDRDFFCIIGLVDGKLSSNHISHEAVHAAFAYEKRVKRNVWGPIGDFDEERIAYPAGYITAGIVRVLRKAGLQ